MSFDAIGLEILVQGGYELADLTALEQLLVPVKSELSQTTAIDIGANIGHHTAWLSDHFDHVHAFEPHPRLRQLLQFNIDPLSNVTVHAVGLSDAPKTVRLELHDFNVGASRVEQHTEAGGKRWPTSEVTLRTLDDLAPALGTVGLLKIDVEGHELNVLKGGRELLQHQAPLVVLEQLKGAFTDGRSPCLELLTELGYRFIWFETHRHPLRLLGSVSNWLRGVTTFAVSGPTVPVLDHPMIVAVPDRLAARLL